jgi:imidazolonepropionase-like amidohydrolase
MDVEMKLFKYFFLTIFLVCSSNVTSANEAVTQILIKNVNIFDAKNEKLSMGQDVLVEANLIKKIGKDLKANKDASIIDGGGRTLMPGLIDMHTHLMFRYGDRVMRTDFDAQASGAAAMETLQLYM